MNPYKEFVETYARLGREGKRYPLGGFPATLKPSTSQDAPVACIFSPHPDDEVIIGALPLRLLRQSRWRVVDVAVTLGSNKSRQSERLRELQACCSCIGFELAVTASTGLERINLATRERDRTHWNGAVQTVAQVLEKEKPGVIFTPHSDDWNSTHIGTHALVEDALAGMPRQFQCFVVETEFWRAMDSPNLMVEVSVEDLGDLLTALSCHVGEVKRNPYHLSMPAWMTDNVRRGGELIGGQGGVVPDFQFATLYRVMLWREGRLTRAFDGGKFLEVEDDPAQLFRS